MSKHLFMTVVTPTAIASNNRGEGDGSTLSTLQKITRGNDQYTTVSAEAIRWGYREYLQNLDPQNVNRSFDAEKDQYSFQTETYNAQTYIDDDLFGFMDAKKGKDNKDATTKRRGALEISRAISLDPYWGDIVFGSKGGTKGKTSIHNTEVHCTAYQYSLALTPVSLKKPERSSFLFDIVAGVKHVGGNHARFLYDFRPESLVIRLTDDPSPWIMNCFQRVGESVGCPRLLRLVEVKDIPASELIVAGEIADTPYGKQLEALGVKVYRGIKEAIAEAKKLLAQEVNV
jgi:CRISPR-associated protein Cst2